MKSISNKGMKKTTQLFAVILRNRGIKKCAQRNKSPLIDNCSEVGYIRDLLHGGSPIRARLNPAPIFCLEISK